MQPQYRIALPRLAIEGRVLPERRGTGVSVMTALAYLQCWDPDAVVAIYPPDHFGLDEPAIAQRVDAGLAKASSRAWQAVLVGSRDDNADVSTMIVCARVSVLWSLARLAQPALMELLDAFVPLVDLEEEDEALALIFQQAPIVDFYQDILRPCPEHLLTMSLDPEEGELIPLGAVRARKHRVVPSLAAVAL